MDYYNLIFKRKSFHIFKNTGKIPTEELQALEEFIGTVKPLDDGIKTKIKIVPESETTCKRGAEYCIEFYSEEKGNYLRNIGYIGEQIDLWLADRNIGALWFGIGKPDEKAEAGLQFVIMIAIAKMPQDSFRKDMFKAKRKPLDEIWEGDTLGVAEIVRFTPSACNTQPWIVKNAGNTLTVLRYKKPGKRGIMPADKVRFYNRIDIGIFIFMLETCLHHEGYTYSGTQMYEDEPDDVERVIVAKYEIKRK
ncbi:MAG: nitroreductase family protein [Lachnospiraceae bacterium]